MELIDSLKDPSSQGYEDAWTTFMLNMDLVAQLREVPTQVAQEVVQGGATWNAASWSTSRASQALYQITKDLLVTTIDEYKSVWLFCLSMLWGLDIASLQLGDRAAEAERRIDDRLKHP